MGHLLDLLGLPRFWPELFDAIVDEATTENGADRFGGEEARQARLAGLMARMTGR